MTAFDPRILPAELPVPEDDGAADHLPGRERAVPGAASWRTRSICRRGRVAQPGSASPSLTAYIAAWVRSVTPSFRRTAETCVFTVFSDR